MIIRNSVTNICARFILSIYLKILADVCRSLLAFFVKCAFSSKFFSLQAHFSKVFGQVRAWLLLIFLMIVKIIFIISCPITLFWIIVVSHLLSFIENVVFSCLTKFEWDF